MAFNGRRRFHDPNPKMEESWEEDLPLTQDQLAIIDGLSTQEELLNLNHNAGSLVNNHSSKADVKTSSNQEAQIPSKSRNSSTPRATSSGPQDPEYASMTRQSLIEKVKLLQRELFEKSGLLMMREEEHKQAKERLLEEQKRLRNELSTVSSEFSRTTEALRSELLFQTKECEEVQTQLRRAHDSRRQQLAEVENSPRNGQTRSPVLSNVDPQSPDRFPTAMSFLSPLPAGPSPRRSARPRARQKRTSEAAASALKTPPSKRLAAPPLTSPPPVLWPPVMKVEKEEPSEPFEGAPAAGTGSVETSPLVCALDEQRLQMVPADRRSRLERELARTLVSLQDEMVSEKIDFAVVPQLRTYEKHQDVAHPLSVACDDNYNTFNRCFHKFVSVTLFGEERLPSNREKAEDGGGEAGDGIRDWFTLLQLLPCLANHVRLFANELLRRKSYVDSIDKDLSLAAGSAEKLCPLTGSGPMDEFFDIVKELDFSADDVRDCPHLLYTPYLEVFRKQVTFALRWLLVIHQFCSRVRPWMHGEPVARFPQVGDIAHNVTRLLSHLSFYFDEELPIKRGALDLFADMSCEMESSAKMEQLQEIKPFRLLQMCSDSRPLSTLHCFEAMRYLVHVPSFREDFNYHRGRRHCLWTVVFHIVNKVTRGSADRECTCQVIIQFASFAIAAARSAWLMDRGCSCYRGMYETLASAALSQAQAMFDNSWDYIVIEAVERPLRALLILLQSQGVQHFEEVTANLFPLFALVSMLKRVETCRHYDQAMKNAMDVQLINELDDLEDEFGGGE